MSKRPLLLGLLTLAALAAGCGSSSQQSTTTVHVPVSPSPMSLTVFRVENGSLHAENVDVPATQAVAHAALAALGLGADVTIDAGTARVQLDDATDAQVAEIVYTLTQFSSVQHVDVAGRTGLTRDDVAAFVPPILVEKPASGATVAQSFTASGTASVFEATLVVEVRRAGKMLSRQTVTASEGAPSRGTFSATVHAPSGNVTLAVYSPSAADGSHQHEQDLRLTVRP